MKTNRFISLLLCVVMIMSLFTGLAGSASADDIIVHEVQSGEIMLKICEKHGLNYYACKNAIMQLNGFTSETQLAKLSVGQKIKLPASDSLASTVSSTTSVVTSTTIGGTTTTTTTNYVGTTATGGNVAFYLTPYTVQAGDTLAGICSKLNSNYYYYSPVILGVNALANANYIRPGQVLLIPTTTASASGGYAVVAHTVQAGENMTAICSRYGISYQAMRTLVNGVNRRDNMDKIYVGQTVYVPGTTAGVSAAATTVTTSGTTTGTTTTTTAGTTSTGVVSTGSGYSISFSNSGAFASVNGQDYVTSAPAGSEVSVWSNTRAGYAVKSLDVVRLDTGAPVPVDYNYFTMPNSNIYVDVTYEKGLTITKAKAQGGSFETVVGGFLSSAAFAGDEVTVLAYPNQYYSVSQVSYQKSDYTVTSVDVKKDASGNYSFTMPSYPITVSVKFAPTQYHSLSYSGVVGLGKVVFTVDDKEVSQAEQGTSVTMKFVADKNFEFNTSDFENNLVTHIPNKSSMGSFKKVNDNTYTFVMGTQDINVTGVQFINRTSYSLSAVVWKNTNNKTNGSIGFNVIDQATGKITYGATTAKFGDSVHVSYKPDADWIPDTEYAKANSKGAGNALLAWSANNNVFTMPDSNVTVNARFIQDGNTHKYAHISYEGIPAAGGLDIGVVDGSSALGTVEVGSVVTFKVVPNPNYDLTVLRVVDGKTTWGVLLNGASVDYAAPESNFTCIDKYTYSFIKSAKEDTIRVVYASDYQGVNATFTQITEGGETVVQGIKGFSINGNLIHSDAQVIAGDTVSFQVALKEGYEITGVRKYAREKVSGNEIPGTTTIIPGGDNNSYSYTVTNNDIIPTYDTSDPPKAIERELVFEITCKKIPDINYTVKYTKPKIDGKTPIFSGSGDAYYQIGAHQISTGTVLPDSTYPIEDDADIVGLSANLVQANDVLVHVLIPMEDVYIIDENTNQLYTYAFDKLLVNGTEFSPLSTDTSGTSYYANFILPKDTPDYVLTTEVTYKLVKTADFKPIPLEKLKIGSTDYSSMLVDNIYDYTFNVSENPVALTADPLSSVPGTLSKQCWLNEKLITDYTDLQFVNGPNKLVIKLSTSTLGYAETTYNITLNYGLEASELKTLQVDGVDVNMYSGDLGGFSGDPALSSGIVTSYEISVTGMPKQIALASKDGNATITWILNGTEYATDDPNSPKDVSAWAWQQGSNTLELIVKEKGKSPTKYTIIVNCKLSTPKLSQLKFDCVNTNESILVENQYDYDVTVTNNPTHVIADVTSGTANVKVLLNGVDITSGSGGFEDDVEWDYTKSPNTLHITVTEEGQAPVTYTVKVTPKLPPAALEGDYLKINGLMMKFTNFKASYSITGKSNADFEVALPSNIKVESIAVNGVELDVDASGAPTYKAYVGAGSKVTSWNIGANTLIMTLIGEDHSVVTYTVNITYKPYNIKLDLLTIGSSPNLVSSDAYKTTNATDMVVAAPEYEDVRVIIKVNGTVKSDTASAGPATPATANVTWDTALETPNYLDIVLMKDGYTDVVYHVDVTLGTP